MVATNILKFGNQPHFGQGFDPNHWARKGLVRHFPFIKHGIPIDVSVNRSNATLTNTPSWIPARNGWALDFNGSNQSLDLGTVDLTHTKICTVVFTLNWDAFANDDDLFLETTTNYNNNDGALIIDPNSAQGNFDVGLQDGVAAPKYYIVEFTRPSADVEHHYVMVFNNTTTAGEITVYVDGVNIGATARKTDKDQAGDLGNYNWYVMSRANSALFGDGALSDFRIYDRGLLPLQAKALSLDPYPEYYSDIWWMGRAAAAGVLRRNLTLMGVGK